MFRTYSLVMLFAVVGVAGCDSSKNTDVAPAVLPLESDYSKLSYGLGLNVGSGITQQNIPELNVDALVEGIRDSIAKKEVRVSQQELEEAVTRIRKEQEEKMLKLADESKEKGAAFLAENAKREGVITTDSGLQYEVIKAGEGDTPAVDSVVETHYHGTLIDGSVFDSSVDRGETIEFGVNQVIPGWTEALQLMKEGDKWRLVIPSNLAYGEYSPGPEIPPHSTLIFDIELIDVKDAEKKPESSE